MKLTAKDKKYASTVFDCQVNNVKVFNQLDPFNNQNISGFMCKEDNLYGGSLLISHINETPITPQLIYGSPKMSYPYKKNSKEFLDNFIIHDINQNKKISYYYISRKWNGTNILFFKYEDNDGNVYISAKTKGSPVVIDGDYGNFFTLTCELLNLKGLDIKKNSPDILTEFIENDEIQGFSFEICGNQLPNLVKYDFDLKLIPLFYLHYDGKIVPYYSKNEIGPFKFKLHDDLVEILKKLQEYSFFRNEKYRKDKKLKTKYELEHFIEEGFVLYLLDPKGYLLDRKMFKIKPKDIEEVNWMVFDDKRKLQIDLVLRKLGERNIQITDENLKNELDMGVKEWNRFSKDILNYIDQ